MTMVFLLKNCEIFRSAEIGEKLLVAKMRSQFAVLW